MTSSTDRGSLVSIDDGRTLDYLSREEFAAYVADPANRGELDVLIWLPHNRMLGAVVPSDLTEEARKP